MTGVYGTTDDVRPTFARNACLGPLSRPTGRAGLEEAIPAGDRILLDTTLIAAY